MRHCFCYLLYFRHHPAHVVVPVSHNKIYLNWRSSELGISVGNIDLTYQREVFNAMNQEIRKEALQQVDEKSAPKLWRPDSITGITQYAPGEQA
jgi:hypothetical protein